MRRVIRSAVILIGSTAVVLGAFVGAERLRRAAPTDVVAVHFEFDREVIRLSARVNGGGPYNLLLDTGTDPSVLDLAVAHDIAGMVLPLGNQGTGVGGSQVGVALIPPIRVEIPGIRARRLLTLAGDLSGMSERMGLPIHGVLGDNFLRRYKLEIDYPAQELRFLPLEEPWSRHTSEPVFESALGPLQGENFPLLPEILINGSAVRATLDIGSNAGVTLYRPGVELLRLQSAAADAEEGTTIGYGGVTDVRRGSVDSVRLGPLEVNSVDARFVVDGERGDTPLSQRGANVGNGLLKHFVVGVDYPNSTVAIWRP